MKKIRKVGVIGAGLMGAGIAQVCAGAGVPVILNELSDELVQKGFSSIQKLLTKRVEKGKITKEELDGIIGKIETSTKLNDLSECCLIIEAVPENIEIKQSIYKKLDEIASDSRILASNTSGISIAKLGSLLSKPENFIGMHFFYPAPIMKLVEVIPSLVTSKDTFDTVWSFTQTIGKEPIKAPDMPGFVVNRVLCPIMNEAAFMVMEGVAPEDIDKGMELGANLPMGPLKLLDFVGLDTFLNTMAGLYRDFGDPKYRPCPLLVKMVESNLLGRKSGRGFYTY